MRSGPIHPENVVPRLPAGLTRRGLSEASALTRMVGINRDRSMGEHVSNQSVIYQPIAKSVDLLLHLGSTRRFAGFSPLISVFCPLCVVGDLRGGAASGMCAGIGPEVRLGVVDGRCGMGPGVDHSAKSELGAFW